MLVPGRDQHQVGIQGHSPYDISLGYKQLLEFELGWDLKQVIDLRPV